ncbi:sialate O-acetylesterase [Jeotgalibaca caeni]|uniref:sialate O-acetylesterase n=1 Tax=Jeotgalibaca caeni TaxID=3028623 RepID=UPI00237E9168|nr:sialate O-acetylesterase [Jeotgalibaca caeni]MDE1548935.1 sialate O-acetylesterase [Jeotgalibaca caeni]
MTKETGFQLPSILSDGMVLQRNKKHTFWGFDHPGETVQITFQNQQVEGIVNEAGKWLLEMEPLPAGGPYELTIEGSETIVLKDVYVGEVWMAGGQSNMELPLGRTLDLYEEEIKHMNLPLIREFHVPIEYNFHRPQEIGEQAAGWKTATSQNILAFSAVGTFFAAHLHQALDVPIGMILTAVGGTPAEAWMKEEDLKDNPLVKEELDQLRQDEWVTSVKREDEERTNQWYQSVEAQEKEDKDYSNWIKVDYDDTDWAEMNVPTLFDETELANQPGSIWFRKTFTIEDSNDFSERALLKIGAIIDYDEVYVNGTFVGKTEYRYPPRRYPVPEGILKEGENVLAVRLVLNGENGGFVPGKFYGMEGKETKLDLSGAWKYKRVATSEPSTQMTFFQYKPTGLYNAMIHPIRHYRIAGFLFYQGESNSGNPETYAPLFKNVINRWRTSWQEELPFLFVQLANYHEPLVREEGQNWAELREQQARVEREVPMTAMTVTIDIGEGNDLHPQNKKDIGIRLAKDALRMVYEDNSYLPKPQLLNVEDQGGRLLLSFQNVGDEMMTHSSNSYFELETENGEWVEASSYAEGTQIVVLVPEKRTVTGVRYAFTNNPENPPYFSKEGNPIPPFIWRWEDEKNRKR